MYTFYSETFENYMVYMVCCWGFFLYKIFT